MTLLEKIFAGVMKLKLREMWRVSQVNWMGSKCNHSILYREAKADLTQAEEKAMWPQEEEIGGGCSHKPRMPAAIGIWKR